MQKKEKVSLYLGLSISAVIILVGAFFFFNVAPKKQEMSVLQKALAAYSQEDYKNALVFFAQADLVNSPVAAFALGAMHFSGKGTPENIERAILYYKKAASLNYPTAQTTLALLYAQGEFIPKDKQQAVKYALMASENDDVEAHMLLAQWYENAEFVEERDIQKAISYYVKAAQRGNENAKIALTVLYKDGAQDLKPNAEASKRWQESLQKQKQFENVFQNRSSSLVAPK